MQAPDQVLRLPLWCCPTWARSTTASMPCSGRSCLRLPRILRVGQTVPRHLRRLSSHVRAQRVQQLRGRPRILQGQCGAFSGRAGAEDSQIGWNRSRSLSRTARSIRTWRMAAMSTSCTVFIRSRRMNRSPRHTTYGVDFVPRSGATTCLPPVCIEKSQRVGLKILENFVGLAG